MDDLQKHINEEVRETLELHTKHLEIANSEMATIKTDIGWVKQTIEKWEVKLENLNAKVWLILSGVILSILTQILFRVLWK